MMQAPQQGLLCLGREWHQMLLCLAWEMAQGSDQLWGVPPSGLSLAVRAVTLQPLAHCLMDWIW